MRVLRLAALVSVLAVLAAVALAQPQFGGRFGGSGISAMLLRQESIQKELKLTDEQINQVEELSNKLREQFRDLLDLESAERDRKRQELIKENESAIAAILKPDQFKRLKQISYQREGTSALTSPEVAKALGLTDAQQKFILKISDETNRETRKLFGGGFRAEDGRKKMDNVRSSATDKILSVLTVPQQ